MLAPRQGGFTLQLVPFRRAVALVILTILVGAAAAGAAKPPEPPGQIICREHTPNCGKKIRDLTVEEGETRTYEGGEYRVEGTVVVEDGGTLVLDGTTWRFTSSSDGILVLGGGTARIVGSTLEPESGETVDYVVDARAGASFLLNTTLVKGGDGVIVAANDTEMSGNRFEAIPLALRLRDTTIAVEFNHFEGNDVSLNQTGGENTVHRNSFRGGTTCIQNYETHPTITENHLKGCHTGILHKRSHSAISDNVLEDDGVPPGTGIQVVDTQSPTIEGNVITNFYTGISVTNARAFIRNNSIHNNTMQGVLVDTNSGPMDIRGNVIRDNGHNGVELRSVADVEVVENTIRDNTDFGLYVVGATGLHVLNNTLWNNTDEGAHIGTASGLVVANNIAFYNHAGIVVWEGSDDALLVGNNASANDFGGIVVHADDVTLSNNRAFWNGADGITVSGARNASLQQDTTGSNDGAGFVFADAWAVYAEDIAARGNGESGVRVLHGGHHVLVRANASGNDLDGFSFEGTPEALSNLTLARALANGRDGLRVENGSAVVAFSAWWEGNENAGVNNLDGEATVESECSYWGHPNGPTTPTSGPRGDRVLGNVDYTPFRSGPPPDTPCNPPPEIH